MNTPREQPYVEVNTSPDMIAIRVYPWGVRYDHVRVMKQRHHTISAEGLAPAHMFANVHLVDERDQKVIQTAAYVLLGAQQICVLLDNLFTTPEQLASLSDDMVVAIENFTWSATMLDKPQELHDHLEALSVTLERAHRAKAKPRILKSRWYLAELCEVGGKRHWHILLDGPFATMSKAFDYTEEPLADQVGPGILTTRKPEWQDRSIRPVKGSAILEHPNVYLTEPCQERREAIE